MGFNALPFLSYGRQTIDESDLAAVAQALQGEFLTTGPLVEAFEAALCTTTGAAHAVAVANGTAALHLAVLAQDLGPDDVVIVPSVTFVSTANAVAFCGAKVLFADVDPKSGLMTDETFADALTHLKTHHPTLRFAGVMPVHLGGHVIDLEAIYETAQAHDAFVIEDACHAFGSQGAQGRVGSCARSNSACFSFHPVKTITTGEGGAITTHHAGLAQRFRELRSHGLVRDADRFTGLSVPSRDGFTAPWLYEMQALGYNYRLPDINCALGLSQLRRFAATASRRKALAASYLNTLTTSGLSIRFQAAPAAADPVLHLMVALIDFEKAGLTRSMVMQGLKNRGIGTQVHYIPVHHQPYWQTHAVGPRGLPGADQWYAQALSLPLYPAMEDGDIGRVMWALAEVLA